ncbi:hypothetical protein FDP41_009737 [Naegleria fowleri]|uniref:non-specific serine/threonine protein kinase n=1 Tax=Naegleria fowleri TaxID=5763 RepID=A0A6A5BB26_NAEFO|nr:uncharacterized protein FDP41_009737 [Naegleria fowleri]KAF0972041.1 hypothetical protein FDP41_009737 [Naegleria fowleri]CAG4716108.1 unnamed protein product [Naegleria fowleri]
MMESFEQPDFAGYMRKRGGFNTLAHRRRWFELRGKHLYYYKKNTDKRPTGVIVLTNAKVEKDSSKPLGLKLSGPNLSRVYELVCESELDFKKWFDELQRAIEYKPKNDRKGLEQAKNELKNESVTSKVIMSSSSVKKASLDDFDLVAVVGRGSFGKVMKVKRKNTNEVYAMKVLRKDMIVKENMVSHTKAEKQILQEINHPFIVKLYHAFQTDEKLYLVLQFLPGGELFFHLKEETKFDVERAKFYAAQIVLAIEHLHKNDIIYRDLKPENVVLDADGYVVLTDFGLAKTNITNATPTYTFCGTPEYLAPEILKGQGHAKSVDWWSLGILLYEMMVGLPPFYSENINEMYELILKAPLKFPNFIPADAQSLLRGLLEREEFKRLGGGPTDALEIKSHPFFSNIDWDQLYERKLEPPFRPQLKDGDDIKYFDEEFTSERAVDSFAEVIDKEENQNFDDFDFSRN